MAIAPSGQAPGSSSESFSAAGSFKRGTTANLKRGKDAAAVVVSRLTLVACKLKAASSCAFTSRAPKPLER